MLICALCAMRGLAVEPWPAETNTAAVKLTLVNTNLNDTNMSGASWNPATRTLWLANNSGRIFALVENGAGSFRVATNSSGTEARWYPGGDLESICQVNFTDSVVYVMDEDGWIREYDVSQYGVVLQNRNWDIRTQCPEVGGTGPEAITFVPDEWLAREGFQSASGTLYTSTNGMGGVMLVGHQSNGYVHVFDLNPTRTNYGYVGRFKTGRSETAGLEFDRETGKLYVWHNLDGNYLEVTELSSYVDGADRRLRQLAEYAGPRAGNLEGFALVPTPGTDDWCFVTDDDNSNSEAVMWYRQFRPSEDMDGDSLNDGWELRHFGTTTQTTGSADSDLDGMNNVSEYIADTDPTNSASVFPPLLMEPLLSGFVLSIDPSSTERLYHVVCRTNLLSGTWTPLTNAVGTGTKWTTEVSATTNNMFYRGGVTVP